MSKNSRNQGSKKAEAVPAKSFANFSVKSILNLFLERWWIGLIVGAVGATAFILAQPKLDPVYHTEVKMLFEPRKEKVLNIDPVVDPTATSTVELFQHIEHLRSTTYYEYVQSSFTPKEIELIQNAYRDPENPSAPPPPLASIIRNNLQVYPPKSNTTVISISVYHRDPEAAALIANRFARKYIEYSGDRAMTGTNGAIVFLRNSAEEKRAEVETAEKAIQTFRQEHNMAAMGENKNVLLQKIGSLGSNVVAAELEQANLTTVMETVENYIKNKKDIFEIREIAGFGSVGAFKGELEGLKTNRILMSDKYYEDYPAMKDNALEIETVEKSLQESINLAVAELHNRFRMAAQHEQLLRKDLAESEERLRAFDQIAIRYKFLEEDAANKNSGFNMIQSRLNEMALILNLENSSIKILDRAYVPGYPEGGTPKQIALMAVAIGAFLLVGVPLGLGFADARVKGPSDVEDGLSQVLLGGIKTMKKLSETERPNVFRLGKDDSLSEAYRGLFSEIEIRSIVAFPKRLLVSSSVPSEGKSLTASNLAAVFAAHGKRTLLVDGDFRRPTLRRYFGAPAGVGLLPWLRENGHRADATVDPQKLGIINVGPCFDLLPAGDAIKNPTEVIDQIAHCDLFTKLSARYDLIVIDTPPSSVFPDALLLSRFCAEMIYVCRFKTVRKALIRKTLAKFTESGITVLGVVLNCVPSSSVLNYGYDGYGSYTEKYYKEYQEDKAEK